MEYLVLVAVVVLFLAGKGFYDKKKYKERIRRMLREDFGTVSEEEYSEEKLKSLQSYFRAVKRDTYDIDDITWNDLNMDDIYKQMDYAKSSAGDEYLYYLLNML